MFRNNSADLLLLIFDIYRSCIFDSATNVFTTGQLTAALMEHIQKVTLEMKTESKKGESQSF